MKNKFLVLWLAGVVGTVAILPYIFDLQREIIAKAGVPLWQVGLAAVVQTAVLLAVAVFFGLKLANRLHLPVLVIFESNNLKENLTRLVKLAIPLGIATALVIKFGDLFFTKYIPQIVATAEQIPFWKNLLAAFYGGVVEEILMRLFVVSLLVWILGKITKAAEVTKNNGIMWAAIIAAAILFGLGHLPATATITALTPIVVSRAILLNGIGGLVFGWLYWKKGLEYAIASHFTTDIVLIAILPLLIK